jgi:hypothetical protein
VARASVQASASLLERNLWIGSYLSDGDAKLAGILVRDTKAAADGHLGVGVGVDVAEGGGRGALELTGSLVEHNENGGLYILGADATIEGTLVRDSLPEPISQQFGRGIQIQNTSMGDRANVVVRDSLVERSMDVGVFAAGADLILERTVIRDTAPRAVDGKIGDGLALFGGFSPTQATVQEVTVANSARAGILNYSGVVTIGASVLECNVIHLNGETASTPYEFIVTSPSVCGCQGATEDCKVLSSMLEPPTAPSE